LQTYKNDRFWVKWLLSSGLILAISLMILGAIVKVSSGHYDVVSVPLFSLFNFDLPLGDQLMGMGVLVLAMTPAFRVFLLISIWFKEKDWAYVGVGVVIVLALATSLYMSSR
jgi:hypothetical protein